MNDECWPNDQPNLDTPQQTTHRPSLENPVAPEKPSCLQATCAWVSLKLTEHILFHLPLRNSSTTPAEEVPPTSLSPPSLWSLSVPGGSMTVHVSDGASDNEHSSDSDRTHKS